MRNKLPLFLSAALKPWDLKTPDEIKADCFLWGYGQQSGDGFLRRRYLKRGTEENDALQALLRVLRNDQPVPPTIRKHLAELLDPKSSSAKRLKIQFRKKGQQPDPLSDAQIAHLVSYLRRHGGYPKMEAAVQVVTDMLGITKKSVLEKIKRHQAAVSRLTKTRR
jgi:hypothetical protein